MSRLEHVDVGAISEAPAQVDRKPAGSARKGSIQVMANGGTGLAASLPSIHRRPPPAGRRQETQ